MRVDENNFGFDVQAWSGESYEEGDERPNKVFDARAWPIFDLDDTNPEEHNVEPGIFLLFDTKGVGHYRYELRFTKDDLIGMLAAVHALEKRG